jgi:hypothetical protein
VKNSPATYHRFTKATALLLLMAFLIPSGLHAKQLVEFCLINSQEATEMAADHSCCESEQGDTDNEPDKSHHDDCGWSFICACHIGESALSDSNWILSTTDAEIRLTEKENLTPFITSAERVPATQNKQLAQHDPPLWLVYDTFLT